MHFEIQAAGRLEARLTAGQTVRTQNCCTKHVDPTEKSLRTRVQFPPGPLDHDKANPDKFCTVIVYKNVGMLVVSLER